MTDQPEMKSDFDLRRSSLLEEPASELELEQSSLSDSDRSQLDMLACQLELLIACSKVVSGGITAAAPVLSTLKLTRSHLQRELAQVQKELSSTVRTLHVMIAQSSSSTQESRLLYTARHTEILGDSDS